MKTIKFNPSEIDNIPKFFNAVLDENTEEGYIMFVFEDIYDAMRDCFEKTYLDFVVKTDLPFAFYPYYEHFNKAMPRLGGVPNPRARFHFANSFDIDVVGMLGYGMLLVNTEKLKSIGFRFDERFAKAFYMQDLVDACFEHGLIQSQIFFLDVPKSFEMLKKDIKKGIHSISSEVFNKEKELFGSCHKIEPDDINSFLKKIQEKYKETK